MKRNQNLKKIVLPFLFLLMFLLVGGCRGCQQEQTSTNVDIPPRCGECLELPTGEVCTVQGTKKNSCLAICLGVKILCSGACPCPKSEN